MGIIKQTSDNLIIDNTQELITPATVRQVNDIIDEQVGDIQSSITTIDESITTLTSSSIPTGGLTGQILSKRSNTDNDVEWIAPPSNNGDFLPLSGGAMTGGIDFPLNIGLSFQAQRPADEGGNYSTWISGNTLGGFRYIAPIDDFDIFFDFLQGIYHGNFISYSSDHSASFTERSLVDRAYVDARAIPSGGTNGQVLTKITSGQQWQDAPTTDISGLLPLSGGAMTGNINMQENWLNNIGGVDYYGSYFSLEERIFDLNGGVMSYARQTNGNLPSISDDTNLVHKGYVDSQNIKVIKEIIETPSSGDTHSIFKQTNNFVVEVWQRQQSGSVGTFASTGPYNITFEAKVGIDGNNIIVKFEDGVIDSNDQTRELTYILVYFYPDTIVTTYDRRV